MIISVLDRAVLEKRLNDKGYKIKKIEYRCGDSEDDSFYDKPELKSVILKNKLAENIKYIKWYSFIYYSISLVDKDDRVIASILGNRSEFDNKIANNTEFSVVFNSNDKVIKVADGLLAWLEFNGIDYKDILSNVVQYKGFRFKGCSNIELGSNDLIAYCSNDLELSEEDLAKVLNSIDDKLLRLKVESIIKKYGEKID